MSATFLLLLNSDHLQQVDVYATDVVNDNCKRLKLFTISKFVFDSGDNSLECFNWAIHNNGLWQSVPVRYRARETVLNGGTLKDRSACVVMVLNVSTERCITMGCGSLFQSDILREKTILDCFGLKWRDIERLKCMCRDGLKGSLCWFFGCFFFLK